MKILLFPILLISVSLSAQEKEKKQLKIDTAKSFRLNPTKVKPPQQTDQQKNIYKMPVAKPKEGTKYSGLNKKIEAKDYKMLKPVTPEKPKDTLKTK